MTPVEGQIAVLVPGEILGDNLLGCRAETHGQPAHIVFIQRRQDLPTTVATRAAVNLACDILGMTVNDGIEFFKLQFKAGTSDKSTPSCQGPRDRLF